MILYARGRRRDRARRVRRRRRRPRSGAAAATATRTSRRRWRPPAARSRPWTRSSPKGQGDARPEPDEAKLAWNTFPPSNGQHYPLWAVWGFYTQPVNPRQVVHNEEHGGVVIWWGPKVAAVDDRRSCDDFYNEEPDRDRSARRIAGLGSKIAITAWTGDPSRYQQNGYYGQGHIAICTTLRRGDEEGVRVVPRSLSRPRPGGHPARADEPGMGPQRSSRLSLVAPRRGGGTGQTRPA